MHLRFLMHKIFYLLLNSELNVNVCTDDIEWLCERISEVQCRPLRKNKVSTYFIDKLIRNCHLLYDIEIKMSPSIFTKLLIAARDV